MTARRAKDPLEYHGSWTAAGHVKQPGNQQSRLIILQWFLPSFLREPGEEASFDSWLALIFIAQYCLPLQHLSGPMRLSQYKIEPLNHQHKPSRVHGEE